MLSRILYRNPSTAAYRLRFTHGIRQVAAPRYYSIAKEAPLPSKRKVWDSAEEAVKGVKSGDVVLSGGALFSLSHHKRTLKQSRLRTWWYTRHTYRSLGQPTRCTEHNRGVEQLWCRRTWSRLVVNIHRRVTSYLHMGVRKATSKWPNHQDDCFVYWRKQILRVSVPEW